jgi:hypothetical protein
LETRLSSPREAAEMLKVTAAAAAAVRNDFEERPVLSFMLISFAVSMLLKSDSLTFSSLQRTRSHPISS